MGVKGLIHMLVLIIGFYAACYGNKELKNQFIETGCLEFAMCFLLLLFFVSCWKPYSLVRIVLYFNLVVFFDLYQSYLRNYTANLGRLSAFIHRQSIDHITRLGRAFAR